MSLTGYKRRNDPMISAKSRALKIVLLGVILLSSIVVFSDGNAEPQSQSNSMDDLNTAILQYLRGVGIDPIGRDMVVSVFVQDLASGETLDLNADVQHSGASVTKLGIMLTYFRESENYPPANERYTMAATIICSSNAQANLLLESIGDGRLINSLNVVNRTFCEIGAGNTALLSPLYIGEEGFDGVPIGYYQSVRPPDCPAAVLLPDEPLFEIDPLNYMMPHEIGRFFAELYACADNETRLADISPDEITPTECEWMIELLSGTTVHHLAELGLPEGTRFAHKVGYNAETIADAGIVFSDGGDYVVVIAIWERDVEHDGVSNLATWHVVGDISRLIYNYFNPDAPLDRTRTPVNPIGAAACVLPINPDAVNFEDIRAGRFDANGTPLESACFNWPVCEPFNEWEP